MAPNLVETRASAPAWRYALASAVGSSHVKNGSSCQDASAGEVFSPAGASVFIGVVADGAGSAPLSAIGARTACEAWRAQAEAEIARTGGVQGLERGFALRALRRFQVVTARIARRVERPLRDFACTLLFAAVDEQHAAFAQIGDGAIVVAEEGSHDYACVFWPQQGEYVNTTNFATEEEAARKLCWDVRAVRLDELALFSDGLQNLVLDQRQRRAHAGFFEPMFRTVRAAHAGRSEELSRALERYLCSRAVEGRTDDDKSLVLASRRPSAPKAALPRAGAAPAGLPKESCE
jgi:serine/threonine protein phosphatase PrpC